MFERCKRCRRVLRSDASREVGYGRVCLRIVKAALLATRATRAQIDKALDLIESGGIVNLGERFRNAVFRVIGSDGKSKYATTTSACSCPAGLAGRLCYHRVAVAVVTA